MKARDGKKKNFYYFLLLHFWQQYKFLVEMISIFFNATFDRYRYFVSLPTACTSTHVSHFTILWQQSCRDSYNTIISPSLLLIFRGNNYFLLVIIPFLLSVLLVILLYFRQLWPAFCAAPISEPDSTPTEQTLILQLTYQPTNILAKEIITRNLHLLRDDHENSSSKSSFVSPLCTS